ALSPAGDMTCLTRHRHNKIDQLVPACRFAERIAEALKVLLAEPFGANAIQVVVIAEQRHALQLRGTLLFIAKHQVGVDKTYLRIGLCDLAKHFSLDGLLLINLRAIEGTLGLVERQSVPSIARRLKNNNRSEEHTSELQSRENLVCRLLLEKKKKLK